MVRTYFELQNNHFLLIIRILVFNCWLWTDKSLLGCRYSSSHENEYFCCHLHHELTLKNSYCQYGGNILRSSYQRCSVKKVFLEISLNSQENTCVRASFLLKERLVQMFSCELCEISKNTFSYRTPLVAAFTSLPLFRNK